MPVGTLCFVGTREPEAILQYIMIILLGRGTNHITDQLRRRKGQQQPSQNVCNRPSVSSLGCCSMQMGTPRISRGVQNYGIHVSDSLDGYVADGRFSLAGLLKPIARGTLHSEPKMRIKMTIASVPHLPLRRITRFTHLPSGSG